MVPNVVQNFSLAADATQLIRRAYTEICDLLRGGLQIPDAVSLHSSYLWHVLYMCPDYNIDIVFHVEATVKWKGHTSASTYAPYACVQEQCLHPTSPFDV